MNLDPNNPSANAFYRDLLAAVTDNTEPVDTEPDPYLDHLVAAVTNGTLKRPAHWTKRPADRHPAR